MNDIQGMDSAISSLPAAEHSVTAASINEAKQLFKSAASRLLSIGEWNRWCNGLSAIFRLSDNSGRILNRKARPHDLVRIDGGASQGSDNCLELSRLITFRKASGKAESISIEVRTNGATDGVGLFEIKRYNNVVTAVVHEPGKPEISEMISFISPLEWSSLVKRLLARDTFVPGS
jgi:hypothetical protein